MKSKQVGKYWQRLGAWQRWLVVLCGVLVIGKFVGLVHTPPGFYVDEAVGAATIISVRETGKDLEGKSWPLYAKAAGGGYVTPAFLYGGVAWSALFGDSEYAYRAFATFTTVVAVALLALVLYLWFGGDTALVGALIGLVIPWSWHQGQLAWDPSLVPMWVAASLAGWSLLLMRRWSLGYVLLLAAGLLGLAYTYPPSRFAAVGLVVVSGVSLWRAFPAKRPVLMTSAVGLAVAAIPLLLFVLTPEARKRSDLLTTWGEGARAYADIETTGQAIILTINNFIGLLAPAFLFTEGDPNLRHNANTGLLGSVGLVVVIMFTFLWLQGRIRPVRASQVPKRRHNRLWLTVFCGVGVSLGILGSALTWEAQPHSLRAVTVWPLMVVGLAGMWSYIRNCSLPLAHTTLMLVIGAASLFFWRYYTTYNQSAAIWYDTEVAGMLAERARQGTLPDAPLYYEPFGQQYYILRERYSH